MAKLHQLNGYVNNSNDGVHIEINATEEISTAFYKIVIEQAPPLSNIIHHSISQTQFKQYIDFTISESVATATVNLILTPDYAMCENCSRELMDSDNHRYQYPFINCTYCGPRYSIINQLPYDRVNTSMHYFELCEHCRQEYDNPVDRRHYAQTNSCKDCGVQLTMFANTSEHVTDNNKIIIEKIITALNNGNIVAIKGIGGYLLVCDAANETVINELRKRKHRPAKPFALLYPSLQTVEGDFELSPGEAKALQSEVAPIVLLQRKGISKRELAKKAIAPGLLQLGVMLPYAPLLKLIVGSFQQPLIATSANISDSPIIYNDEDALRQLPGIANFIVTNNRKIVMPQDDSVIKFSPLHQQKIILRRSRGIAPSYFGYASKSNETILATGALLKSSFTFTNNGNTYVSQYLGNTDSYEAQQAYRKTAWHFIQLFNQQPQVIIADKHPLYFATQLATGLSEEFACPLIQLQHHKAHAAAVLAENSLLNNQQPVLCVVWDGTGLGDDGNIWGGEFFVYENKLLSRRYHFDYFPMIFGDKMPREPRLSALCICSEVWMAEDMLRSKFNETEWALYQKLLVKTDNLQCSSVGRVFDAVASLLNLSDKQTYEGEAALLLETLAQQYFTANGYSFTESYFMQGAHLHKTPTGTLFAGIIADIRKKKPADFIAAKFHYSLVQLVKIVAGNLQLHHLAFSGGVFQNSVLVDLLQQHLGQTHQIYFHQHLSPNDENISFGQMVYYDNDMDGIKLKSEKELINSAVTNNSTVFVNAF